MFESIDYEKLAQPIPGTSCASCHHERTSLFKTFRSVWNEIEAFFYGLTHRSLSSIERLDELSSTKLNYLSDKVIREIEPNQLSKTQLRKFTRIDVWFKEKQLNKIDSIFKFSVMSIIKLYKLQNNSLNKKQWEDLSVNQLFSIFVHSFSNNSEILKFEVKNKICCRDINIVNECISHWSEHVANMLPRDKKQTFELEMAMLKNAVSAAICDHVFKSLRDGQRYIQHLIDNPHEFEKLKFDDPDFYNHLIQSSQYQLN